MTNVAIDPTLDEVLNGSPYVGYSYAYPHKTAYRELSSPVDLESLWQTQRKDALFLYFHIPFCEFRCGFCNLFTVSQPHDEMVAHYLAALRRQANIVAEVLGGASFARLAFGGGTPTFLEQHELEQLFDVATNIMGVSPTNIPVGMEASPATVSREKLALLRQFGVDRISLGVQSFDDAEAGAMGRPQRSQNVQDALQLIRDAQFPTLNIDLIYGGEGQTIAQWIESVEAALAWQPEEFFLYPLYVRPLTGLGKLDRQWDDHRLSAYREARALLLDRGYRQVSMRMFRATNAADVGGPVYCCQEDGMAGLGCGARSYTAALHYADRYAVKPQAIASIVGQYNQRDAGSFAVTDYGFELNDHEQRRRYVIISLLQAAGMARRDYIDRFGRDVLDDLPHLPTLELSALATIDDERIQLTPVGLERSDAIGPWLYTDVVRDRMETYEWA